MTRAGLPLLLLQFVDTTCMLCAEECDALAEPLAALTYPDREALHGLVCQRCIEAHYADSEDSPNVAEITGFDAADVDAFAAWAESTLAEDLQPATP